jgi:hypothetical protein
MKTERLRKGLKYGCLIFPDVLGLGLTVNNAANLQEPAKEQELVPPSDLSDLSWLFLDQPKKPAPETEMAENPTLDEIGAYIEVNADTFKEFLQFIGSLLATQEFFCQQPDDKNYQQFKQFVLSEMEKDGRDFDLIVEPYSRTALQISRFGDFGIAYLITRPNFYLNTLPWTKIPLTELPSYQTERVMIPIEEDKCDAYFWILFDRLLRELATSDIL